MDVAAVKRMAPPGIKNKIREIALREADAQIVTKGCLWCDWTWTGPLGEAKVRWANHMRHRRYHAGPRGARNR